MNIRTGILLVIVTLFSNMAIPLYAQNNTDSTSLDRVMSYRRRMSNPMDTIASDIYVRYYYDTQKRNIALGLVPTLNAIARGGRKFAGETYSEILVADGALVDATRLLDVGTVPHNKSTFPTMLRYLMPNIYEKSLLNKQLLSPFNRHNRKLYRYHTSSAGEGEEKIAFRPRHYNTQLVSGSAIVDKETGRVISVRLSGEYDMVRFRIDALMGDSGQYSLFPQKCDIEAKFHFLGNKIITLYHSSYDNGALLPDTVADQHNDTLMSEVRPEPLPENIKEIYDAYYAAMRLADSTQSEESTKQQRKQDRRDLLKHYFINRTNGSFGSGGQGSFRFSPIINPLYLSYSKRKGISYKMTFAGSYDFTERLELALNFKAGYSFKQHQFYFTVPLRMYYNRKRNDYVMAEVGNGNRISYSNIINNMDGEPMDSSILKRADMNYFTDLYLNVVCNYNITRRLSVKPGLIFHRRSAVDTEGFALADLQTKYYSFAPKLEVRYIPIGARGPVFTADYERGVKVGKANMVYERYEFDASWLRRFNMLRSLSLRVGGGFYSTRKENAYFLDYVNFRDESIPVGWNDNWSGEFQLLRSSWYNSSRYYVRTNFTYESPMMMLARIPFVGNLMEMERIYVNTLFIDRLHPYVEYGYGFTNRFFSAGLFLATRNSKYSGIGFRIALELFRDW